MIATLQTFAAFVLVLGILVFVHELGHFLAAKAFKIGVPVFSLGFGPRLFGLKRGGTDYRVSAIPLGGYVRLAGDESDEHRSGAPEEFLSRPRHERFVVYVAGAAFNIVLAVLVAWMMFSIYGKSELPNPDYPVVVDVGKGTTAEAAGVRIGDRILAISGKDARDPQTYSKEVVLSPRKIQKIEVERDGTKLTLDLDTGYDDRYHLGWPGWSLQQTKPKVQRVIPSSPAEKAGLIAGDVILGVDDREPVGMAELTDVFSASPGRSVRLKLERDGVLTMLEVTPRLQEGKGMIGVQLVPAGAVLRQLSLGDAFREAVRWNVEIAGGIFFTLKKLFRAEISMRAFSGPIEIAQYSREAVKALDRFLYLLVVISLNLGIFNLLPVPVLDGGHLMILTVESIMRRDLSEKLKERVMQVGFVFLVSFFLLVIFFDVDKSWSIIPKIKSLF